MDKFAKIKNVSANSVENVEKTIRLKGNVFG